MNEIIIELKYDKDDNEMTLDFNTDDEIKIDLSADVDLSEYVKKLTFLIEKKKKIKIEETEFKDQKLQLIQNTIVDIINSFNEVVEDFLDANDE